MTRVPLILIFALAFSGCVSQHKVVVDFSPILRDHFMEYPTIEVDIAAVTDAEIGEIRGMGVENYFAPGSGVRSRLQAQTVFFFREELHAFVLPSRAPVWRRWLEKDPTNIMVIASLPHDPSMSAQADPRLLTIPMSRSVILANSVYIWVEPKRITRGTRSSTRGGSETHNTISTEQWVEIKR